MHLFDLSILLRFYLYELCQCYWKASHYYVLSVCLCFRKYIIDSHNEDPNYNPLPEDRPGGFDWGQGQQLNNAENNAGGAPNQ